MLLVKKVSLEPWCWDGRYFLWEHTQHPPAPAPSLLNLFAYSVFPSYLSCSSSSSSSSSASITLYPSCYVDVSLTACHLTCSASLPLLLPSLIGQTKCWALYCILGVGSYITRFSLVRPSVLGVAGWLIYNWLIGCKCIQGVTSPFTSLFFIIFLFSFHYFLCHSNFYSL